MIGEWCNPDCIWLLFGYGVAVAIFASIVCGLVFWFAAWIWSRPW